MRETTLALVAAASLATGACSTIGETLGLAPRAATTAEHGTYMGLAAASELFEIEAANVALARAQRPEVRAFAAMLLREHTRSAQALATASQRGGFVSPAGNLSPAQQEMISALQTAGPGTADALYIAQQVAAHRVAYEIHRRYALVGESPELREFAAMAAPMVREHQAAAERIG